MIMDFVRAWNKNERRLKEYLETHKQGEYCMNYKELVKLLFDMVINPYVFDYGFSFSTENIIVINDDGREGTMIFILPNCCDYSSPSDYVFTSVYYGSCPICDVLQCIHNYEYEEIPSKYQVWDYMQLCLHLLQHCHYMKGYYEVLKYE